MIIEGEEYWPILTTCHHGRYHQYLPSCMPSYRNDASMWYFILLYCFLRDFFNLTDLLFIINSTLFKDEFAINFYEPV